MTETAASMASDPAHGRDHASPTLPSSAGERLGWLFNSLWLAFLAFPLIGYLTADHPAINKAFAVIVVAVFAAIYIQASRSLDECASRSVPAIGVSAKPQGWAYMAALVAVTLVAIPVFGPEALGFTPFLCAWAIVALSPTWGVVIPGVCVALSLVVAATVDSGFLFFAFLNTIVSVANAGLVFFMESGRRTDELRLRASLAADQERVARDVHDVLGHSLTAVVVKSELAQRLVVSDPARAQRELAEIESLSRAALGEIRATVGGLRASRFADEIETSRRLLASAGIDLDVADEPVEIEPQASVVLAWAVREATTNIVRHADARTASIRWGANWVEITDDGRGIESGGEGARSGSGLVGLRERLVALGGSVVVENRPDGSGTRVRVDAAGEP